MYKVMLVMVVLAGCVADAEQPTIVDTGDTLVKTTIVPSDSVIELSDAADLCALAAELPVSDVCSLICDPDAMKVRLADDGMAGGTCYQLRCVMPNDEAVLVGVCLAPTP